MQGVDELISRYAVETLVCVSTPTARKKNNMRFKRGRWLQVVNKLDEDQVRWLVRENRNGMISKKEIAMHLGVSVRWVQKLCVKYRNTPVSKIVYPEPMGRPKTGLPGRREHSAVLSNYSENRRSAVRLEKIIRVRIGIHIPHRIIQNVLKDEELAENQPAKARRRKWIRYERRFSNSLWHTDYKQLPDGRWFICYMDDASRFIVSFGVFEEATAANAIKVLEDGIQKYGKPAGILTDHGSQFYANQKENAVRGESEFEKKLVELDIKHSLARVKHPQTNGKLERFHSEIEQHLESFRSESATNTVRNVQTGDHVGNPFYTTGMTDPISRLVEWYNNLEHMSLKDGVETPA